MDLSIIIVSWNTRDLLKKCLQSIYAHTQGISFEVFVIDNASRDGTLEMLRETRHRQNLCVISNPVNRGFAAANNQGIKNASGNYILLLNPDTELQENSPAIMIQEMSKNRDCGILGCHLANPDGSHQDSVRRFPRFLDQTFILLKLHHLFPHASPLKRYVSTDFDYEKAQSVDQVMGACFMIRKQVIDTIGFMDENFFNWFEEVDFCKRAQNAGYTICYTPKTMLIHHYGQSFKQVMAFKKQLMWNKSLRYYFKKHHTVISYITMSMISWIALLVTYGYSIYAKYKDQNAN